MKNKGLFGELECNRITGNQRSIRMSEHLKNKQKLDREP